MNKTMTQAEIERRIDKNVRILAEHSITIFEQLVRMCVGALAFQYVFWNVFQQDLPWYVDLVVGMYFRLAMIKAAVVVIVLRHCNFSLPLWDSVKTALGK